MAEQMQKPAAETSAPKGLSRRDAFAVAVAQGIITRQSGRTPKALAREVVEYTDALLAELDSAPPAVKK